jgi:hypothetical protein
MLSIGGKFADQLKNARSGCVWAQTMLKIDLILMIWAEKQKWENWLISTKLGIIWIDFLKGYGLGLNFKFKRIQGDNLDGFKPKGNGMLLEKNLPFGNVGENG